MGLHISLLRHRRSVQVTLSLSHCIIQFWLFYAAKYYKTHRFENYNTEEFDPNRSGARGFFKRTGLSDIMQQGGHGLDSIRKGDGGFNPIRGGIGGSYPTSGAGGFNDAGTHAG